MHVPTKLGYYPLALRDYDTEYPRPGELLLNYTNYDLYFIDRDTNELTRVAEDIYKRMLAAKAQNTNIIVLDEKDKDISPIAKDGSLIIYGKVAGHTLVISQNGSTSKNSGVNYTLYLTSDEYMWPQVDQREYNTFYYITTKTSTIESNKNTHKLYLDDSGCYVANSLYERDTNGHILVAPYSWDGYIVEKTATGYTTYLNGVMGQ